MAAERQELARAAEKLVSRGRIRAAIEQYRKILEGSPDDTGTLNRVGDLYVRIGRLDKAISLFQRTAQHFVSQGFLVKAIAILKKILRLDPTLMDVYESLADLYERQGLVNDARGQYQVVADYYQNHGELGRCAAIHRKLVDLEPDDPTHRLRLAELYEEQEHPSGAMEQYRGIAKLMLAQGEVSDATRFSVKAMELDPEDLGFMAALIQDFNDSGHSVEAKLLVELATQMNPAAEGIEDLALLTEAPEELSSPDASGEGSGPAASGSDPGGTSGSTSLSSGLGEGKVEIWTSEGTGKGAPEVDVLDLDEVSFDGDSIDAADETSSTTGTDGAGGSTPALEFEFDLDDLGGRKAPGVEPPAGSAPQPSTGEPSADRIHPKSGRTVDELYAESEVLQRYGLEDKSAELLEELLEMDTRHIGALTRLLDLEVSLGRNDRVASVAERLQSVALHLGIPSVWEEARERLEREGASIGDDLSTEATGAPGPAPDEVESALESAEDRETPEEAAVEGQLLADDADFFDLASELEAELDEVTSDSDLLIPIQEEQSLEEIVAGFRRGMQETLSAEDYETHFNLGIAYREMELIDEAIGEFQLAAKEPRHLIECCSHLAGCFVAKGLPELAVKWYEKGLETPGLEEQERLGLLYELGDLHLDHGDVTSARNCFVEVYGTSSSFRDVVARIEELDTTGR